MSRNSFRQIGLLPIYKSDQLQDWQLSGYYNNWLESIQYVPRDTLVSFSTPPVTGIKSPPSQITARKLNIKGNIKTILSSTDLAVTMYAKNIDDDTKTYYYFIQSTLPSVLDKGCVYEIYIEDADGNSFISNIFVAIDETEIFIYAEDSNLLVDETGEGILFE